MTKVLDQTNLTELFKVSAGNIEALQALTDQFRKRLEIETAPTGVEHPKAKAASAAGPAED